MDEKRSLEECSLHPILQRYGGVPLRNGTRRLGACHLDQSTSRLGKALDLLERLRPPWIGVVLYGSVARGDADEKSDIDVLQVVDGAAPDHYSDRDLSVTTYSLDQLEQLCIRGSLFALHLVTEGRILDDPSGAVAQTLAMYRPPDSYRPFWEAVRLASQILDVDGIEFESNPAGFTRLALYVTRTASILRHLELKGRPSFSLRELAVATNDPDLEHAFDGRDQATSLDRARFLIATSVLSRLTGEPIKNQFGSLEALAVNVEVEYPVVAGLAMRLLAGEETLGYGDLFLDPLLIWND